MEEKTKIEAEKKKNSGLIIIILILVLLCGGMGTFVFINKDKLFTEKSESKEKKEIIKETKQETVPEDIQTNLKRLSSIIFKYDKNSLEVNGIDKEVLIKDLVLIDKSGSITETTGTRLKELALKYFNISDLKLVNITCGWDHNNQGTNVMYIYNSSTDKYEYNPEHGGHGGGNTGISVYKVDDKAIEENDYYIYSTHIFYKDTGCISDTCGPLEKLDIYYTYEDLVNKSNKAMNAVTDDSLCKKESVGYTCDENKIYEKIKANTKIVKFYYKKLNDNYVFEKYIVE